MRLFSVFPELTALCRIARRQKAGLWLVGGFLRDHALGRDSGKCDLDFAVSADALKLARAFAKHLKCAFVLLDDEAGCGRVARKKGGKLWTYDFSDLRAPTLAKDLTCRDFTINTLALDLLACDPDKDLDLKHGVSAHRNARADIKSRVIRMASPKAFSDDPLRLIRAYSLRAQTGFSIHPRTLEQIRKQKKLVHRVSQERVREELFKILDTPRAAATLKAMDADSLLVEVLPQIEVMRAVRQGGYHHLDVWKHSLAALVQLEKLILEFPANGMAEYLEESVGGGHTRRALLKLACLLHDIGKPETRKKEPDGRMSFHGHEHAGRRIVRAIAKALLLSTSERHALEDMVLLHLRPGYLSNFKKPSDKAVYRFMRDAKDEAVSILLLSTADQRATRGPLTTDYDVRHHEEIAFPLIKAFFDKKKEKPFVRLITGHDLITELKLKPGPEFAAILKAVDEEQHLGKIVTREAALECARRVSAATKGACHESA